MVSCIYAGLVTRTNITVPNVPSKHCGNHRQAHASKSKPEGSKSVLDDAAKLANLEEQPTNAIIFRRTFAKIRATGRIVYWLVAYLGGSDKAKASYVWAYRWSICFPYRPKFSHSRHHERSSLPPDFGLFRRYFAKKRWSKFNVQRSVHRVICVVNCPTRSTNTQFIYIYKPLYVFRVIPRPSSGTHMTVSTVCGITETVTATCRRNNGLSNGRYCRYIDMSFWWWVDIPSETCTAVGRYK